ncbi:MAG: hypothetical protein [Anelloviridae sp.]|nr:MAG: hypothetical protein [Anelloviridae sp.]
MTSTQEGSSQMTPLQELLELATKTNWDTLNAGSSKRSARSLLEGESTSVGKPSTIIEETNFDSDYDDLDFFSDEEDDIIVLDSPGAPPPLEGDPPDEEVDKLKQLLQLVKKI